MDKVVFYAGLAGTAGGVFLFLFQGITYVMHNVWTSYPLYLVLDYGPEALKAKVDLSPGLAGAMESCPLFVALIAVGLVLLLVGSRLSGRYLN